MLFWIEIDGDRVAVQVVNRLPNPYWRLAPYTIVYPTPKQREVRITLTKGAHNAAYGTMADVNREVKLSFKDWQYTERPPNRVYEALKVIYGDEVDEVMKYIKTQRRVEQKLKLPAYRTRLEKVIENHLVAAV